MNKELLIREKARELEGWARLHGIVEENDSVVVTITIVKRPPVVRIDLKRSVKGTGVRRKKSRRTDLPITTENWKQIFDVHVSPTQMRFLKTIKESGNTGTLPHLISYSVLENINARFIKADIPFRVRSIEWGEQFPRCRFKVYRVTY
jgi:hypothetical protein